MTDLPAVALLNSPSTTNVDYQGAITDLHQVVAELLGGSDLGAYTINAGVITPVVGTFSVDTEAAGAADDLDVITPTNLGEKLVLVRTVADARVVTLKHLATGDGEMRLLGAVDAVLDSTTKWVLLRYDSVALEYVEVMRNWGVYTANAADIAALAASHDHDTDYEPLDPELLRADTADIVSVGYQTTFEVVTYGAGITLDFTKQKMKTLAVTGGVVFTAQTNTPGGEVILEATMDATGGYTIDLTAFNILSGTFNNAANIVNIVHLIDWGGDNVDAIIYQRP